MLAMGNKMIVLAKDNVKLGLIVLAERTVRFADRQHILDSELAIGCIIQKCETTHHYCRFFCKYFRRYNTIKI
jgi:hypothetical protein